MMDAKGSFYSNLADPLNPLNSLLECTRYESIFQTAFYTSDPILPKGDLSTTRIKLPFSTNLFTVYGACY